MKKLVIIMILIISFGVTACGNDKSMEITENGENVEEQPLESIQNADEGQETEETTSDDNFAVDEQEVIDFAQQVKEAVLEENIEKLADLTAFPTYVGFKEEGITVETRDEFLALDQEKLFAVEMLDSIKESDATNLKPSMAGFTLQKDTEEMVPSITFGMAEGKLSISGINY